MKWKAYLEGDEFDVDALIRLLGNGATTVGRDEHGPYLASDKLDAHDDATALPKIAADLVCRINGIAAVRDSSFRPVSLTDRYQNQVTQTATVFAEVHLEGRGQLSVGAFSLGSSGTASPPPPSQAYLNLADSEKNVADALTILGGPTPTTWKDLYDVFEIVRDDVGGPDAFRKRQWWSKSDESAFTGSANRPDVSGRQARHARVRGQRPKRTLDLGEGRDMISVLVARWIESHLKAQAGPST